MNAQQEPPANADTAWLFQPKLVVTAAVQTDRAVFCPIDDPLEDQAATSYDDAEERHLRLLYRNQLQHAVGPQRRHSRTCPRRRAVRLPAGDDLAAQLRGARHDRAAGRRGDTAGEPRTVHGGAGGRPAAELAAMLSPLAHGYAAWLDEQAAKVPALPEALKATAEAAIFTARQCAQRIQAGIDLVTEPGRASPRRGTGGVPLREPGDAPAASAHDDRGAARGGERARATREAKAAGRGRQGKKVASWRPFQLAFMLLNLPALTDPAA